MEHTELINLLTSLLLCIFAWGMGWSRFCSMVSVSNLMKGPLDLRNGLGLTRDESEEYPHFRVGKNLWLLWWLHVERHY